MEPLPANKVLEQAWMSNLSNTANGLGAAAATTTATAPELPRTLPPQFFHVDATDVFGAAGRPLADAAKPPPPSAKWYLSSLFIQTVCVVAVFLLTLILMVSIRPPFLYVKNPEDKTKDKEFSTANAAWVAFGTALASLIIMVVFAFLAAKKKNASIAPAPTSQRS